MSSVTDNVISDQLQHQCLTRSSVTDKMSCQSLSTVSLACCSFLSEVPMLGFSHEFCHFVQNIMKLKLSPRFSAPLRPAQEASPCSAQLQSPNAAPRLQFLATENWKAKSRRIKLLLGFYRD